MAFINRLPLWRTADRPLWEGGGGKGVSNTYGVPGVRSWAAACAYACHACTGRVRTTCGEWRGWGVVGVGGQ